MSLKRKRARERIIKKVRRGYRDYPIVTISFYGPDDKTATKVVVGCVQNESDGVTRLERWFSEDGSDLRFTDDTILRIDALLKEWGCKSVVMPSAIIGCPHEEGIDYPEGESCPECPFWENRDRWSGVTYGEADSDEK